MKTIIIITTTIMLILCNKGFASDLIEGIRVFEEPPEETYQDIGLIEATDKTHGDLHQQAYLIDNSLKKQTRKLGGNAFIVKKVVIVQGKVLKL